jgi:hypothetical protein
MKRSITVVRKGLVATVAAAAVLGVVAALASAASNKPTITFVSPPSPAAGATLTTNSVAFEFTYNRRTKQTRSLVCSLQRGQTTVSSGPCDHLVDVTGGAQADKSYSGLANGDYTFTVSLALTDGGTATATRHFSVAVPVRHLYWTNFNTDTIGRANLDGTGANQGFITGASRPSGVAVDANHVYWTNFIIGTIGRANLDGTGANQSFITGATGPSGVAVDADHVYWANAGVGTIGRADLNGFAASVNQSFITGATTPLGVAVDAD